ncbi:hypothetical protein L9F63_013813 [Diploptera punctata]|uniref:Elongator complex protein 5 n=1 Tax=Diploptera punctata TaxID=6984 RepID=A0AAD8A9G0_DIPPU|nr:hypothetical protein L9F63_013813 [Diploptera punctata]
MLASVSSGLSPSALVCIKDSLEQTGHDLLKAFICNAVNKKENQIHMFCYENSVKKWKSNLKNYNTDNVHLHDCFTDHRGWLQSETNEELQENKKDYCILSIIQQLESIKTNKNVIIIDSLTPLIINIGFTKCYRELHYLSRHKNVLQCICLVHEDALPDSHTVLPYLDHLATSNIRIGIPTRGSNGNPVASITHKKLGGKIINEIEFYTIDSNCRVTSQKLEPVNDKIVEKSVEVTDNTLPQNLTTFKLSLGNQEKQARSELVLPYVRINKEKGGKVFYQPDAADDWDEEDPDDDLDI